MTDDRKSSPTAKAASVVAVAVAVYELFAIWTGRVPTVTAFVQSLPWALGTIVVGALIVWLMDHFGWIDRLRAVARRYRP